MKKITKCLACGSKNIHKSLDLGKQPLANNYLKKVDDTDNLYPLCVNLCHDCYHLQLTHIVDPSIIYENYLYVSGTTQTLRDYSKWFANFVNETITKKYNSVLDIGCNDGTQLNYLRDLGYNTFGIDPAKNLYETSSLHHTITCDYFKKNIYKTINQTFDAITAQNVFAHNPNPLDFLLECKKLMGEHSLLFIQTSQANMVLNNEFDTIYHEHINFFNINSMKKCVERAGLEFVDVIRTPIHGTSYVFILGIKNGNHYRIQNAIACEQLDNLTIYQHWENTIKTNMQYLQETLVTYRKDYKIIGYGAAAKGNTLLNYIKVKLDYIIDDNELKQGTYTPGMKIPIVSIDILNNIDEKILFIPLAWNFFNEIRHRIKKVRQNDNDRYIKYFPKVQIDV